MRELDLTEMEQIEGGDGFSCFGAVVGIVGLSILVVAGGPVGWLAWGSAIASGMSTGFALGDCTYDLAH